ncbi:MAG: hypothetical protein JRJ24_06180 [Deltaproteobacteria bacterium]|nr:hypothetical protein [Deltaproteobacteria bacterium]
MMRWIHVCRLLLCGLGAITLLPGCPVPPEDTFDYIERFTEAPTCDTWFGIPGEKTGLPDDQCMPKVRCDCSDSCESEDWFEPEFFAPQYSARDIAALREWTLVELPETESVEPGQYFHPKSLMGADPYTKPAECATNDDCDDGELCDAPVCRSTDKFCAILPLQDGVGDYVLVTYGSEDDALFAGALITHRGPCGLCSPLQDLAVYIEYRDLTDPVRQCGVAGFAQGIADFVPADARGKCIAKLGFDGPCTEIWGYNTAHTGKVCGTECGLEFNSTHNKQDGEINSCLACDETKSGAIFKAVAGRTRRASGLPSAICRPGAAVYPVEHFYGPRSGGL